MMVKFDLLEEILQMKAGLKFVLRMNGVQYVMTVGIVMMAVLSVNSWDTRP